MPLALGGSPTTEKDKRNYKEVQELLLLHRRYEEKAVRLFRKGLSVEETSDAKRQARAKPSTICSALDTASTEPHGNLLSPKLHCGDFMKPLYLNDKDYLKQLLLKDDANAKFSDHSLAGTHNRAQLRLPKLESIPPESKEIFYTTLPKMPPLPKIKETKVKAMKPQRKEKRSRHHSSTRSNTLSSETCLTIRQLPRDHFMLHDSFGSVGNSSSLNVATLPHITRPNEINLSSETISTDKGCLWLVPFVNIEIPPYRLAKWNEIESGCFAIEEDKPKELQKLKAGVHSDGRIIEGSRPKYKRNVHFSEFLHEIHLYSPISTAQSARSREDINGINNE